MLMEIRGKLLQWVEAFLTERRQRVVVQGAKSQWSPVVSGIPQGSVLGPTLFIIFVNDIPTQLHGSVKLFADDAKVYSRVKRPDGQSSVQVDLDALGDWSSRWLLPFNVAKCKVMHLGPAVPQPPHRLNGVPLQEVDREKDLGIIVDQELKFHQQTAAAAAKASQMLAVAKRSFAHIDTFTLPLIYKTPGEASPRIWQPCLGPLWEDRPEAFGKSPAQGHQTRPEPEATRVRRETTDPQAPIAVLQAPQRRYDSGLPDSQWWYVSGRGRALQEDLLPRYKRP